MKPQQQLLHNTNYANHRTTQDRSSEDTHSPNRSVPLNLTENVTGVTT